MHANVALSVRIQITKTIKQNVSTKSTNTIKKERQYPSRRQSGKKSSQNQIPETGGVKMKSFRQSLKRKSVDYWAKMRLHDTLRGLF